MGQLSTLNGSLEEQEHRTLDAPVQLAEMAASMELEEQAVRSVWTRERDDILVSNFFFFLQRLAVHGYNPQKMQVSVIRVI